MNLSRDAWSAWQIASLHQFVRYRHMRQFVMYRRIIDLKRKVILFGAFNFVSAVQDHLRRT